MSALGRTSLLMQPTSHVLNPGLYNRLELLFGQVAVHHRGEEMSAVFVTDPYSGRRRLEGPSKGEYYAVDCPFCGDTRKRLWVNYRYGSPGVNGMPMRFLAVCYNETQCMSSRETADKLYTMILGKLDALSPYQILPGRQLTEEELDPSDPPGDVAPLISLPDVHPAVLYMTQTRKLDRSLFARYEIGYCLFAKARYAPAADRIIFPVRFNGAIAGWQARQLFDYDTADVIKYYTKPNMPKSRLLYNLDYAASGPFGVICEGVMHALRIPEVGVATFGSHVSHEQMRLASAAFSGRPLVVCLDFDAYATQQEVILELSRMHNGPVVNARLAENYDISDYTRAEVFGYFKEQAAAQGVELTCPN